MFTSLLFSLAFAAPEIVEPAPTKPAAPIAKAYSAANACTAFCVLALDSCREK